SAEPEDGAVLPRLPAAVRKPGAWAAGTANARPRHAVHRDGDSDRQLLRPAGWRDRSRLAEESTGRAFRSLRRRLDLHRNWRHCCTRGPEMSIRTLKLQLSANLPTRAFVSFV